MSAPPTYSIQIPSFPCRALAALAGRASLGGDREAVLAVYMAARLASGVAGPHPLTDEARQARAAAARGWLTALVLPPALRASLTTVADAAASGDELALANAVESLADAAAAHLDVAAMNEISALVAALRAIRARLAVGGA